MVCTDILKWVFRFAHMTAGCFVIGNSISNVIWTERDLTQYFIAYVAFGLSLLVSGVINIFLLKPSTVMEEDDNRRWKYFMYGKAAIWILFIPIPDLITEATGHIFPRKELNAALSLIILVLSIAAKTLRDSKTKSLD